MNQHKTDGPKRVNIFIEPHTRHRLNRFKADLALATGHSMSQDDAINQLLNHYQETAPEQVERARELA